MSLVPVLACPSSLCWLDHAHRPGDCIKNPSHDHYCKNTPGATQREDWHVCEFILKSGRRCGFVWVERLKSARTALKPIVKAAVGESLASVDGSSAPVEAPAEVVA